MLAGMFVVGVHQVAAQGTIIPRSAVNDSEEEVEDDDVDDVDITSEGEDLPVPVLFGVQANDIYDSFGDARGGGSRAHEGLDMLAPAGTPVVSPTDAEVERIGRWSGAGEFVITEAGGEEFRYFHLEDQADHLNRGADIEAGEPIGFVGSSGNATEDAPHLHLEIREDGEATNPYPRVTEDLSLEEKMSLLEGVFADADEEDELAEFLINEFESVFIQARRQQIPVPDPVADRLSGEFAELPSLPQQNLTVGARGTDVRTLQQILIDRGYLDIATPTGYFGPLTESALADYQQANDISPASGYYGPITRTQLQTQVSADESGTDSQTNQQLTERIMQLREQVQQLRQQLEST